MKEFELEKAKMGYPLCTRGGRDARIICYDRKGDYPIVALIAEDEDEERDIIYATDGRFFHDEQGHYLDLMLKDDNATPKEKVISEDPTIGIPKSLYDKLCYLGIIDASGVRGHNFGSSDYNENHLISPWSIFLDHPDLDFWDMDIIKRVLRKKDSDPRLLDYKKIKHDAEEKIRQLEFSQTK